MSRRAFRPSILLVPLACAFAACSDDDDTDLGSSTPPTLEITGYAVSNGTSLDEVKVNQPVAQPCDGSLLVRLGPTDGAGRLVDWDLRPPGSCGRINQCGFISVRVLSADGSELGAASAASIQVAVDLTGVEPQGDARVVAELRQGTSGDVFTVRDPETRERVPVRAEAPLTLVSRTCPSADPGGGGAGGLGGGPSDGSSGAGGLGGLGGFGGAL